MATTKRTKKTTNDAIAIPTEYNIGGVAYRLVNRDEWSSRQDDYAVAILAEFALDQAERGGSGTKVRDVVRGLIRSGLYRQMLGVALQPEDAEPINADEDALDANVQRFEEMKTARTSLASQEVFAATMGVVMSFFGSEKS